VEWKENNVTVVSFQCSSIFKKALIFYVIRLHHMSQERGKPKYTLRENIVAVPLFPPQNSHGSIGLE
jgi:uncharacterized protein YcsI (UPF0317 family)